MTTETTVQDEIFPKDTTKSYAIVEMMPGESPMVGKGPDDTVFSFPVVLLWELILLLGVTLAIFLFSLVKQAPLEQIANPQVTSDPAKAPWYFVGLQELLEHMHPTMAGVIVPTVLVVFLVSLPYIDNSRQYAGSWFSSPRGKRIVIWSGLYALLVLPTLLALDNAFSLRETLRGVTPGWVSQWLLPAMILAAFVLLPLLALRSQRMSRREVMLALFTVMLVSAAVLTISGFLFRGPGFEMFWPWDMPNGYNPWAEF